MDVTVLGFWVLTSSVKSHQRYQEVKRSFYSVACPCPKLAPGHQPHETGVKTTRNISWSPFAA